MNPDNYAAPATEPMRPIPSATRYGVTPALTDAKRGHALVTDAIARALPPLYSQEETPDPLVVVKFFDPCGSWTWYATEGSEDTDASGRPVDFTFFGLVDGHEVEIGCFSFSELVQVRGRFGIGIERDCHWTPKPLSEVRKAVAS